jgi:prepilin-type N-terminal cleavage/methylation domain-containing protein
MNQKGLTLMEVLVSVTLLSLLSVAMFMAMRIGLNSYVKADARLMDNRRAVGAQRIVEEEIEGFVPVLAVCNGSNNAPGTKIPFFQGEPEVMRLVSTFSLQGGWRGQPQVLELFVIPGENGRGVRLVVNETLYTGPAGAGRFCMGARKFLPVDSGPQSFVLADKLAYCRFAYLTPSPNPNEPPVWKALWTTQTWPLAVRVEMAPLEADPSRIQPITVTAPIYLRRSPEIQYGDF